MNETNTTTPEVQTEVPAQAAPVADQPTATDDGPKKINRSEIDTLFQFLGYAEATTWTEARLAKKIRTIEPILEKDPSFIAFRDKLAQPQRDLYEELKKIVAIEDASINIIEDRAGQATTAKKTKATKAPKAPKPAKAPKAKKAGTPPAKNPGTKRDAFGCSEGSRGYDAMALFVRRGKDAEPLKVKEIVDQSGHGGDEYVGVFYNFLNGMVQKGLLIKTDKGYRMSAAGWKVVNKAQDGDTTPAEAAVPAPVADATQAPEVAAPAA